MYEWIVGFIFIIGGHCAVESGELRSAVSSYWEHLSNGQKGAAARHVETASLTPFLARREPPFGSWRITSSKARADGGCSVSVSISRLLPGGDFEWTVQDPWYRQQSAWQVRVIDQNTRRRGLWAAGISAPVTAQLEVFPRVLKFHALNPLRPATLVVRNGLDVEVQVRVGALDEERFVLEHSVSAIRPGANGRITLTYRGKPSTIQEESRIMLEITTPGDTREFEIPILYNHISPGARALLGIPADFKVAQLTGHFTAPRLQLQEPNQ